VNSAFASRYPLGRYAGSIALAILIAVGKNLTGAIARAIAIAAAVLIAISKNLTGPIPLAVAVAAAVLVAIGKHLTGAIPLAVAVAAAVLVAIGKHLTGAIAVTITITVTGSASLSRLCNSRQHDCRQPYRHCYCYSRLHVKTPFRA
jgi:hypothetical protein